MKKVSKSISIYCDIWLSCAALEPFQDEMVRYQLAKKVRSRKVQDCLFLEPDLDFSAALTILSQVVHPIQESKLLSSASTGDLDVCRTAESEADTKDIEVIN